MPHSPDPVFCHVDADCFYASCERLRHPSLAARPVCVLSSHDACVVAKTYDAKAAGITTGMPVWEAKKRLPQAVYLPADFGFYGQVSSKMFAVIRRFSPRVEPYSIDEGFLDLSGMAGLFGDYQTLATELRDAVRREVGVTVSVGVAASRTLAKMASEFHKPNGVTVLEPARQAAFLAQAAVEDIPGIGGARALTLQRLGAATAGAFAALPQAVVKAGLGKVGLELWHELNGQAVFPIEVEPPLPQQMARTASMGEVSGRRDLLLGHLAHHTTRLAVDLCARDLVAGRLAVFIRKKNFDTVSLEFRFQLPCNAYGILIRAVEQALEALYQPGELYRGCGVVAGAIQPACSVTPDFFGAARQQEKLAGLVRVMSQINRKYGNGSALMLAALPVRRIRRAARFHYPMLYVT